jgi:RHS repeat-associated protein
VDLYYVHTDHLNTPRRISRPSDNAILWRWDSDPFGSTAANEDPDGDTVALNYHFRFPGQYLDAESGLSYNYFRDYDPVIGRYIQSDPIGLAGGTDTYAYVANRPTMLTDPTGELAQIGIPVAEAAISGIGMGIAWYESRKRDDCKPKCERATPENIRSVLASSTMKTLQPRVSASVVQLYVESIEVGNPLREIKVDRNVIVDGNHRYIAALLCKIPVPSVPGTKPMSVPPIPVQKLQIDP